MIETMPANLRRVNHGGLMRCCIATLEQSTEPSQVGTTLDCQYEPEGNKNMIVGEDGVWRWNRPGWG